MSAYTRFCLLIGFYFLIPSDANCGNTFSGNKPSNWSNPESSSKNYDDQPIYEHFHAEFRAVYATEIPMTQVNGTMIHHDKPVHCNQCGVMHDSSVKHHQDMPHSSSAQPCSQSSPPSPPVMNDSKDQGHQYDPNCKECQDEMKRNAARQQSRSSSQWNEALRESAQGRIYANPTPEVRRTYCDKCDCHKTDPSRMRRVSTRAPDLMTFTRISEASDNLRRANNVILYGVSVPVQADVINYVLDVLNTVCGENLTRSDVDYVKIFYPKRKSMYVASRIPPVCIRFNSFERKKQLLKKRHMLENTPYKICNDLTPRQVVERRVMSKVCDALRAIEGFETARILDDRYLMVNGETYTPADLAPLLETLRLPMVLISDLYLD